jgi:hypothetical protein
MQNFFADNIGKLTSDTRFPIFLFHPVSCLKVRNEECFVPVISIHFSLPIQVMKDVHENIVDSVQKGARSQRDIHIYDFNAVYSL